VLHITNDSYSNKEIKKKISLSKAAMTNLTKIIIKKTWKFQPTQQLATADNSLSSSAVGVQREGDKGKTDSTVHSMKGEWISD
jgi:hypothetical protein